MESAEREALRLRALLQVMVHELRSPLLEASSHLEEALYAQESGAADVDLGEYLRGIQGSLERLHGQLTAIRAMAGQQPLRQHAPVSLSAETLVELLQAVAGRLGIVLAVEGEPLAPCTAEPRLLEVALEAVLGHAVAYAGRGVPLQLRGVQDAPQGQVCYAVSAAGPALSSGRERASPETLYLASGLAISQQILLLLGGWIHWEERGDGAVAWVRLPKATENPV